ncbi:MAG: flavin reductase family protein [Pseudodonghicola sp.]
MGMGISADIFREAMSRFPGVVTLVTTREGEERRGITATAVCSVTAEPPSLLVCLNQRTGTCASVGRSGHFNVNLLGQEAGDLALRFAGAGGVTGEEKFATGDWRLDDHGMPYLADALLSLSCDVTERIEAGSHIVYIGAIREARFGQGDPLLYERSAFRALAPVAD